MSRGTLALFAAAIVLSTSDVLAQPAGPTLARAIDLEERAEAEARAGRGEQAESLAARALLMREAVLGAGHTATAPSFAVLGLAHVVAGRMNEAVGALERALELRARALGESHPSLAADHFHVAEAELRLGRLAAAAGRLARARELVERQPQPRPGDRRVVLAPFALVRALQGQESGAELLLAESLATLASDPEARVPASAALAADRIAYAAWRRGERARCEPLYARVVRLSEEALGDRDPELAVSLLNLGTVLHDAGRLANAEHLYRRALGILEGAVAPRDQRLAIAIDRLATLCADAGREREAARLQSGWPVCWARAAPPSGRARCRPRSRPAPPRPSRSLPWSRPFGRGSVERMRGCCRASCRPPAADAAGRPTPGSTTSTKS